MHTQHDNADGGGRRRAAAWWTVAAVVAVVAGLYAAVLVRYAARFGHHNVTGFVCMGDRFCRAEELPPGFVQLPNSPGYDGTFFYFIARDPFLTGDWHRHIDAPAYRYQRIVYPLLAALGAGGRVAALPWSLVVVNLLAVALGTLLVALMLRAEGRRPWPALCYGLLSGLLLATLRDLSEPVATALMVGALAAYARRRLGLAAAALSLALLARETTALLVPVLWADSLLLRKDWRRAAAVAAALVPFGLWQIYVSWRLGTPTWAEGQRNFGAPVVAMAAHARDVFGAGGRSPGEQAYLALFLLVTLLTPALAVRELFRRRDEISLGLLVFALLPFVMARFVWVEPWSYGRVLLPAAVFLVLAFVRSGDRLYLLPLGIHAALFVVAIGWLCG